MPRNGKRIVCVLPARFRDEHLTEHLGAISGVK